MADVRRCTIRSRNRASPTEFRTQVFIRSGNQRGTRRRPSNVKFRLVSFVALAAVLVACGSSRSTKTLEALPVEASPAAGAVLGAPSPAPGINTSGSLPVSFGTIEYRLGATLPPLSATALAYDVTPGPAAQLDRHRVAVALGIDDSDRHLFVGSGAGSWSFDANCAAPPGIDVTATSEPGGGVGFACASAASSAPAAASACASNTVCTPDNPPEPVRPTDLPSMQAATEIARSLFHSLGVDIPVDGFHVTDGVTRWFVSADPEVEGMATTGRTFSATIGPQSSILAASGFLGTPVELGNYPLVDAATIGFARLLAQEAHRPRPMIAIGMPCRADVSNCGDTPQVVIITGVHVALQQVGTTLVPVFVFEAGPNQAVPPVPAVTDDLLHTTVPTVLTIPRPEPGTPQPLAGIAPSTP